MPALLDERRLFVFRQGTTRARLDVFRLAAKAVGELLRDVVLPVLRQLAADGDEVAID
jgi:hypothetical protein